MKTVRSLYWRAGGILLTAGIGCTAFAAWRWETGSNLTGWIILLFAGLAASVAGMYFLGWAMQQAAVRLYLLQHSMRVRISADLVSKKRRRNRYYIQVRCVSPILCREVWISSCALMEDPKPYLKDGVEILFDYVRGDVYYMNVDDLK